MTGIHWSFADGSNQPNPPSGLRWDQTVCGRKANKKSVQKSHSNLIAVQKPDAVELIGTLVYIKKRQQNLSLQAENVTM